MSASWARVIPTSSSPARNRCCVAASIGNDSAMPAAGTSTRSRSTSMTISVAGSSSIAAQIRSTTAVGSTTGTRPFFVQLLRKMSEKLGAIDGVEAVLLDRPHRVLTR